MSRGGAVIGVLALALPTLAAGAPPQRVAVRAFENGRWFDGTGFRERTLYVVDGRLSEARPPSVDAVVDLQGRFVIPPLAEGHIHDLNRPETLDERIALYLSKGIYYVLVQDAMFPVTPEMETLLNRPTSVDVAYVHRTVLTSWSQPVRELILPMAREGLFGDARTVEDLDGRAFFVVESMEDLDAKWPAMAADPSRFLKVRIAFSEQYDARRGTPDALPLALDPTLVPVIVARGKVAGRDVSAHIETRADFRLAVDAGVDMITHLPGWQIGRAAGFGVDDLEPWMLTDDDARRAAERGVVVVTTSLPKTFLPDAEENLPRFRRLHRHNLRLLVEHGVTIAIGSDNQQNLTPLEIEHLAELDVLDPAALLRAATEVTPRVIFPGRRIGRLEEGYEASFLVLDANPLEDLHRLESIRMRVKQGEILGDD